MFDKTTTNVATMQHLIHQLPAGIFEGDTSTELFGCRETKKVFALSNGKTIPFNDLNPEMRAKVFEKLLQYEKAMEDLKNYERDAAIERFAFCIFGAADNNADFDCDGELKEAENFICSDNCQCLNWASKKIMLNGSKLTPREFQVVQLFATDMSDKMIADQLGICISTLDTHKSHLFEKANVYSKSGLIVKAIEDKIIQ